jgi:multicomponent Na+:H+ antiporter subunit G
VTEALRAGAADVLVVVGVAVMSIGVYGLLRMPDVYTQLHASSKTVVFGVIAILAAAAIVADERTSAYRALLIAAFLLLTTPVAAHSVARAAHLRQESMTSPEAGDEGADAP